MDHTGTTDPGESVSESALLLQIQALGQLPSPSHTALRLFSLLQSEDHGLNEIAAVVKSDPALTVRLLRLANRPGNGAVRPVAAVEEALMRLGVNAAVHLSAGLSVLDKAMSSGGSEVHSYVDLCHRSLAAAVASEWICGRTSVPAGSAEMFTCCLLARVGQLALLRFYPEPYSALMETVDDVEDLLHQERQNFGMDHLSIGVALLRDWGFPDFLVDVIRQSESSADNMSGQERVALMGQVLRASWDLAPMVTRGRDASLQARAREVMASFGINIPESEIGEWVSQLQASWKLWNRDMPNNAPEGSGPLAEAGLSSGKFSSVEVILHAPRSAQAPAWQKALEKAGFSVKTVSAIESVRGQAIAGHPTIVVISFEDASGSDQMTAIRKLVASMGGPVILVSGGADEITVAHLLEAGVEAVLSPQVSGELMAAQVARLLRHVLLHQTLESERGTHRRILSQLALTTRKLHRQTLTDPLTGLANRRMGDAFLKRHWAQAERRQTPLSCMVIDLDNFKKINDAYGHDAGDRVLQVMAEILKRQLRQEDLVVRLGGDEFLMICPLTTEAEMSVLRNRLQVAVSKTVLETGPLGFSAGVAQRDTQTMKGPEDLLRVADQRLMSLKRGRR